MATNSTWTVVFDDKKIINQSIKENGQPIGYNIDDDSFWNDSKWSNLWAIQYVSDNLDHNDTVEYRDETPHATWNESNLGSFQVFIDKWDAKHLIKIQIDWDSNDGSTYDADGNELTPTIVDESNSDKIARLGARPTSYSS